MPSVKLLFKKRYSNKVKKLINAFFVIFDTFRGYQMTFGIYYS